MKISGQNMEVTVTVYGRDRTFSEEELIAILEEHFLSEVTQIVAKVPTEEKWFKVDPLSINQDFFNKEKEDKSQEDARQLILKAFAEVKSNPEKYGKKFKTMMPKRNWRSKTVSDLEELACKMGDHNADWVEQALEWAQRIANGESWQTICNDADTANWFRLVKWYNGYARSIGGSRKLYIDTSATNISNYNYYSKERCDCTVPLVVRYEK